MQIFQNHRSPPRPISTAKFPRSGRLFFSSNSREDVGDLDLPSEIVCKNVCQNSPGKKKKLPMLADICLKKSIWKIQVMNLACCPPPPPIPVAAHEGMTVFLGTGTQESCHP